VKVSFRAGLCSAVFCVRVVGNFWDLISFIYQIAYKISSFIASPFSINRHCQLEILRKLYGETVDFGAFDIVTHSLLGQFIFWGRISGNHHKSHW